VSECQRVHICIRTRARAHTHTHTHTRDVVRLRASKGQTASHRLTCRLSQLSSRRSLSLPLSRPPSLSPSLPPDRPPTLTHSLPPSITHSLTHSLSLSLSLSRSLYLYLSPSLIHTHIPKHTHTGKEGAFNISTGRYERQKCFSARHLLLCPLWSPSLSLSLSLSLVCPRWSPSRTRASLSLNNFHGIFTIYLEYPQ